MGLNLFSTCGSCNDVNSQQGNPQPANFKITNAGINKHFTIIEVNYPDCKNYEGNKILVYKGNVLKELMAAKEIDPHFCEKHLSPIARFAPTDEGLMLALNLGLEKSV